MNRLFSLVILLLFILTSFSMAGDEDKPIKYFSTLKPDLKYDELGLVWIHQPGSEKIFGSKAEVTMQDALDKLEQKGKSIGADMIIGIVVQNVNLGDQGLLIYGTAIKFVKP